MTFVDELTVYMKAGDGGNGVVRWLHEKNKEFGGPAGGDGGQGGNVYALTVRDTALLSKYYTQKKFISENGNHGGGNGLEGKNGEDLIIPLPIGSCITNKKTGETIRLDTEGKRILLLTGGRGGRGNESYKSSKNVRPDKATGGKPGEDADFYIELELIADAGLIGLPSAGKTSILNALTNANKKVGAYHFTTLEPNLGEYYGFILADIPGLIEGASLGKGLGHAFLRHVRRTHLLIHLVSLESETPLADYATIRKELEQFDVKLSEKKEVVFLSKADMVTNDIIKKTQDIFAKTNIETQVVSIQDEAMLKKCADFLTQTLKELSSTQK
jgi:GTP-binding protein